MQVVDLLWVVLASFLIVSACDKSRLEIPEIPEVRSNLDKAQKFGIYLLTGDSLIFDENNLLDTARIRIIEDPIIGPSDIQYYDLASHAFHLTKKVSWQETGGHFIPFIFAENGAIISYGYFYNWPNCCFPQGPVSLTVYNETGERLLHTLPLSGIDLPLVVQRMPEEIKRTDFTTEIVRSTRIGTSQEAEFELVFTSNLDQPVYFLNLENTPEHARSSLWYPSSTDQFTPEEAVFATEIYNPNGESAWSLDWYVLIEPGSQWRTTIRIPTFVDDIAEGDQEIILTYDNLAGVIPKDVYDSLEYPVWIGRIIHKQTVSCD